MHSTTVSTILTSNKETNTDKNFKLYSGNCLLKLIKIVFTTFSINITFVKLLLRLKKGTHIRQSFIACSRRRPSSKPVFNDLKVSGSEKCVVRFPPPTVVYMTTN